jgi:hypothetical protein
MHISAAWARRTGQLMRWPVSLVIWRGARMRGAWPVFVVAWLWLWLWRGCAALLVVLMMLEMPAEILGAKPHHAALPRSFRHGHGTHSPTLPSRCTLHRTTLHAGLGAAVAQMSSIAFIRLRLLASVIPSSSVHLTSPGCIPSAFQDHIDPKKAAPEHFGSHTVSATRD